MTRAIYDAMIAHARAEIPAECCGLLAGTVVAGSGHVVQHLPLVNALTSPTEFESDPRSMFEAHKAMRASDISPLAIYHSHPTSDPIPSRRDLERNYSDQVMNIIIGLRGTRPEVRAWWLSAGGAREADFQIDDDAPEGNAGQGF